MFFNGVYIDGHGCPRQRAELAALSKSHSIHSAQATRLLDGSDAAPPQVVEAEDDKGKKISIPNPAYAAWVTRDAVAMTYLLNSFSPEILVHVVGLETTAEVWGVITKLFSCHS